MPFYLLLYPESGRLLGAPTSPPAVKPRLIVFSRIDEALKEADKYDPKPSPQEITAENAGELGKLAVKQNFDRWWVWGVPDRSGYLNRLGDLLAP